MYGMIKIDSQLITLVEVIDICLIIFVYNITYVQGPIPYIYKMCSTEKDLVVKFKLKHVAIILQFLEE